MKHFYRSLESSRERPLRNTVNVWDHMSRCLEQLGWSACAATRKFVVHEGVVPGNKQSQFATQNVLRDKFQENITLITWY